MAAAVATLVIRAQRWVRLLRPVGHVPLGAALSATAIGFASGVVLPLRLGELVRPALLGRRTGIGLGPALSSVVVERLLDVLFIVLCFLALSVLYPLPGAVRAGARGLAVVAAAGFGALLLAQRHRPTAERWLEATPRSSARARSRGRCGRRSAASSTAARRSATRRTLSVVLGFSAYLWIVTALLYLCAIRALDLAVPAIPGALASVVIVAAFVFLPQAPGLVGTWQAGCVVALGLFGVPQDLGRRLLVPHLAVGDAGAGRGRRLLPRARGPVVARSGLGPRGGAGATRQVRGGPAS